MSNQALQKKPHTFGTLIPTIWLQLRVSVQGSKVLADYLTNIFTKLVNGYIYCAHQMKTLTNNG